MKTAAAVLCLQKPRALREGLFFLPKVKLQSFLLRFVFNCKCYCSGKGCFCFANPLSPLLVYFPNNVRKTLSFICRVNSVSCNGDLMVVGRFRRSSAVALPHCTKPPPAGKEPGSSRGRGASSGIRQIICTFCIHQMLKGHGTPQLSPHTKHSGPFTGTEMKSMAQLPHGGGEGRR